MAKTVMLEATTTEIGSNEENSEISKVLQYLAPWIEKTDGEESVGSWETTMATKMMVKLLELWLTQESRDKVAKMLEYYHPLDRAAGGVCDDGHEDGIQECHGDSALQDHLSDAKGRHADADVCRSHEVHDAPIWEEVKKLEKLRS